MASPLIVAGRQGAREMPITSVWRRYSGQEFERRWWGPADSVFKLQGAARVGAAEVVFTQSPGSAIGILTARYTGTVYGSPEIPVETVTIQFKDEPVPINRNPTFIDITDVRIAALDALVETDNPTAPTDPLELIYFNLKLRKVDSYRAKLPVVVWTRVASFDFPTAWDVADVGMIFTTEDFVDIIGDPILFDVPTGNVGIRETIGWTAGWMKDAQTEVSSDGKSVLTITGEFGLWEDELYEVSA